MEDWDETADSHDEVLFSETIDKRQKMLETVMQIDGEMKAVAGKKARRSQTMTPNRFA
jgi:hypothetical protein